MIASMEIKQVADAKFGVVIEEFASAGKSGQTHIRGGPPVEDAGVR